MKNNKTDATNVLKFFREAKEAKQGGETNLDIMNHGGTHDPPTGPIKRLTPWEKRVKAYTEKREMPKKLSQDKFKTYNEEKHKGSEKK